MNRHAKRGRTVPRGRKQGCLGQSDRQRQGDLTWHLKNKNINYIINIGIINKLLKIFNLNYTIKGRTL